MFSETTAPETLRRLAEQYKDACKTCNDRLQSCGHALRQGNTAEAVRLAEMEPNLLDVYTILDFPERNEWADVVATLAFAVPPPLAVEYARDLNDAYDSQNAVEPFLKRYRLAALSRAPLAERIALLREIVQVEPQNIVWVRDQESLEKVRIAELNGEIKNALKENNLSALTALQEELSHHWIAIPPQHLREQVELVLRSNRLQLVEKEMREYAEKLVQAHLEFDHGKSMLLYEKIMQLQKKYRFSVPEDIAQTTRGAVAWLQEESQRKKNRLAYHRVHEQMLKALNGKTPLDELLRLSHQLEIAAADAETSIPEEIAKAIENEIDMRELQRRRKLRLTTTVVAAVCLLILGVISLFAFSYAQYRRTLETIATLEQLKEESAPAVIRNYLSEKENELTEAALGNEQIAALLASLRDVLAADDRRIEQFENKRGQLADMLIETKNTTSPHAVSRQEGLLNDLEQLAKTTVERSIVETLRREHLQLQSDLTGMADREILGKMQAVQNEMTSLNNDRETLAAEKLDRYRELLLELEAASTGIINASPRNRDRCRNMIDGLQKQIETIDSSLAMQGRMAELQRLVGHVESYRKRLGEIATKFPDKDAAQQLHVVADEFDGVALLIESGQLSARLAGHYYESDQAPQEASAITQIGDRVLPRFVDVAQLPVDVELFDAIKAVAKRPKTEESQAELFTNTKKILTAWQQKPVWPLYESPDGPWYYVTTTPERRGTFEYRTRVNGPVQRRLFGETFFRETTGKAQVELAKLVSASFDQMTQRNWTATCTNLITQVQNTEGIDPILKYQLLKTMIREFGEHDAAIQKFYGRVPVLLNDRELENYAEWLNPELPETVELRQKAVESLAKIEWPKPADVAAHYKSLTNRERAMPRPLAWVGFLNRDSDGWKCVFAGNVPPEEGELIIVRRAEDASTANASDAMQYTLVRVGQVDAGHKVIVFDRPQLLYGAPVFLKAVDKGH